jgi:hypothetical protein
MQWDKNAQLRNSAIELWPGLLTGGRRIEIGRIRMGLVSAGMSAQFKALGYVGGASILSADSILEGWKKAGWIEVSPDQTEIRLHADGEEQLAQWQEEDRLWRSGETGELELPKRLKAGEPATNLRRVGQVIGKRSIECVHDPYTRAASIQNLLKLSELGTLISPHLRLLGSTLSKIDAQTLAAFLHDLNTEKESQWEVRTYAKPERPHRRFLICADGSIITCGLSLNNLNKDEVLDVILANDKLADHDQKFFEEKWKLGTPVK